MYSPDIDGKPVPNFPGYRVTPDGIAWTQKIKGSTKGNFGPWKQMKQSPRKKDNRLQFSFRNKNGMKRFYASRLVLELFVGPCPDGMEACHNDGNRTNNRVDNLRWDTHVNNEKDKITHGTGTIGIRHPMVKLTEQQVLEIRELAGRCVSYSIISLMFNISKTVICNIHKRKSWRHL